MNLHMDLHMNVNINFQMNLHMNFYPNIHRRNHHTFVNHSSHRPAIVIYMGTSHTALKSDFFLICADNLTMIGVIKINFKASYDIRFISV